MAAFFILPTPKVNLQQKDDLPDLENITQNSGIEPTKLDMEIAKFLRFNVPRKSTMMQKQQVEYFVGSKAVDILMESKWANGKKGVEQIFVMRDDATKYLNELLQKRFFYRVLKVEKEQKKKKDEKEEEKDSEKSQNEKEETKNTEVPETTLRKRKNIKKKPEEVVKDEESESNKKKGKTKNKNKEKKNKEKVKKRYKLTRHDEQNFFDSKDVYIWLYNPVSWKTIIMGIGVLLCVVAATLFPLWPPEVRTGVYYLSVAGGIFVGSIFVVALARTILYGVIWLFTGGKHHLWILPNILADVGFFESFQPWYTHEYKGSKEDEEEENEDDDEEQESDEEDSKEDKPDGEEKDVGEENVQQKTHSQSENSTEASESESAAE